MYFTGMAKESFGEGPKGQRPKDHDIPNGLWRRNLPVTIAGLTGLFSTCVTCAIAYT